MNWLLNLVNVAGNRIVHIPASEVQAYVDTLNSLRNPDSDPAIAPLSVTDWRFFEKASLLGLTNHLIQQATPHGLQPVVQIIQAIATPSVPTSLTPTRHADPSPAWAADPAPDPIAISDVSPVPAGIQ